MKIVGLKIDEGLMAASVVEKGLRRTEVADSFSQAYSSDGELVELLKDKSQGWRGARIVSSLPGRLFTQRVVRLPFDDRKRVEKALPFELEDTVPFALDDVVIDHLVLEGLKKGKGADASNEAVVLALLLPKELLKQHLDLLASAGIDPQAVVPSYAGLHALSAMMQAEGNSLLACGRDLCLRSKDTIKELRSFSPASATAGLRHTVQAFETELKERVEKASVLCVDGTTERELAELGITVEQVAPELGGKKAEDPLSLGLALSEEINFRKGAFGYRVVDEGARHRKRTLIIAGAMAVFFFAANLGVKYYVVQKTYGRLDKEIKDIYRQADPNARTIADPVRQLKSSLAETEKKYGVLGSGTSALDVMKAVNDGIPKDVRVSFLEFNLEGNSLKLQGEATSFEALDKIKAELQKSDFFSDVAVQDTRMGADNKVKFRIDIKLKQAA